MQIYKKTKMKFTLQCTVTVSLVAFALLALILTPIAYIILKNSSYRSRSEYELPYDVGLVRVANENGRIMAHLRRRIGEILIQLVTCKMFDLNLIVKRRSQNGHVI